MQKIRLIGFICLLFGLSLNLSAQSQFKSFEVSDEDGIPVLVKHLPDYENARNRATHTNNVEDLRAALGERPVFDLIDFAGGTEAVAAAYPEGKLLIIEYVQPRSSIEADERFRARIDSLATDPPILYRRIGNYNAFVFDATDAEDGNLLLDQVQYEKRVQWLGEDPYYQQKADRFFALQASDIFISTVIAIVLGIVFGLLVGAVVGFVYFRLKDQRRQEMAAFSDAGGMVRLNLDDLTAELPSDRLLNK
jgi:hypothetical protein